MTKETKAVREMRQIMDIEDHQHKDRLLYDRLAS